MALSQGAGHPHNHPYPDDTDADERQPVRLEPGKPLSLIHLHDIHFVLHISNASPQSASSKNPSTFIPNSRAIAIKERILGPDHPGIAIYLNNFAGMCADREQYNRAEKYYKKALRILEKARGADHKEVKSVLGNMIILYRRMGKEDKALKIEERLGIAPSGNE